MPPPPLSYPRKRYEGTTKNSVRLQWEDEKKKVVVAVNAPQNEQDALLSSSQLARLARRRSFTFLAFREGR